jgi:enoyl-CoA hydratase/carnithine racemase
MAYDNLIFDSKDHIAIITLNHPPVNAWNWDMMIEFEEAIDLIEKDKSVRVLIITGAGEKAFSAGFDLSDSANAHKTGPKGRQVWTRLDRFSKPVIAAINGHALGGGLELALCCHFRIVVEDPDLKLGLTELNVGIIPGWGGTQRLTRIVGKAVALDMILLSKPLSPRQSLDKGLVNLLTPPGTLMQKTADLAQQLAKRPPLAVGAVLSAMSAGEYEGLDKGLEMEEAGSAIVGASKDKIEGFNAFLEKREPVFIGE